MKFDRWTLGWERTWAYRLFKAHHTELNSIYWAHKAALLHAFKSTGGSQKSDPATSIFSLPPADATRLNIKLEKWATHYGDFDNWVRLSCVVAIAGYLEVYMKTVCRLAVESSPALLIGGKKEIDGLSLLKTRPTYDYSEKVLYCVKGTWHSRLLIYEALFGPPAASITAAVTQLESLRRTRNGTSHAFGRAVDDYDELCEIQPKKLKGVSEAQLKKYLQLADHVALETDKHLGPSYIGEYESLYFYHKWDKTFPGGHMTLAQALQEKMAQRHGRTLGLKYHQELISFYNKT